MIPLDSKKPPASPDARSETPEIHVIIKEEEEGWTVSDNSEWISFMSPRSSLRSHPKALNCDFLSFCFSPSGEHRGKPQFGRKRRHSRSSSARRWEGGMWLACRRGEGASGRVEREGAQEKAGALGGENLGSSDGERSAAHQESQDVRRQEDSQVPATRVAG